MVIHLNVFLGKRQTFLSTTAKHIFQTQRDSASLIFTSWNRVDLQLPSPAITHTAGRSSWSGTTCSTTWEPTLEKNHSPAQSWTADRASTKSQTKRNIWTPTESDLSSNVHSAMKSSQGTGSSPTMRATIPTQLPITILIFILLNKR